MYEHFFEFGMLSEIDTELLISLVQERPTVWDKSSNSSMDASTFSAYVFFSFVDAIGKGDEGDYYGP